MGSPALLHNKDGRKPIICPKGTDSCKALTNELVLCKSENRYGLLCDIAGDVRVVLPPIYDSIQGPCQGFVLAYAQGKGQLYKKDGTPVYAGAYDESKILNRRWLAGRVNNRWQAIHLPTLKTFPSIEIPKAVGLGHCLISNRQKNTLLDSTAKNVGNFIEDALAQPKTDRLIIKKKNKWYLQSDVGKASILLKINGLEYLSCYTEGLAAFRLKNKLWGFVDELGYIRISPRYKACTPFQNGIAGVQIDHYWALIDHSERFRLQPIYDSIWQDTGSNQCICYSKEGVQILSNGMLSTVYRKVFLIEGSYLVEDFSGWGLIDHAGKPKIPMWYASLSKTAQQNFIAQRGVEYGVLSAQNDVIVPFARRPILYNGNYDLYFVFIQ
jgi:hypothetical protein